MTTCIIAEKPSVARDIARIVGATTKQDGYLAGNGYLVTWAMGHLITCLLYTSENLVDELVDDIVGDLPLGSSNDDWKEAAWQRKLRRQSKVHLRRRKR